ncbi:CvpA family protein [Promineifilum sp.]|uniref:CvpA family protein n=1 Tax=Promineifilum sp. TaxID=2664178 RepID=UPI0035AE5844
MLSLNVAFWIMVILFALVGAMRGWTREVVVTSSLILALFIINQFMAVAFGFFGWDNSVTPPDAQRRWQFFVMSSFLIAIGFFGYQGPTLARSRVGDKLTRHDNLQDKVLGAIVGAVNGWLLIGSIWCFLEYKVVAASNWMRYAQEIGYPFDPSRIIRPAWEAVPIVENLPIPFLTGSPIILPLLMAVVFLFVLVVLL